LNFDIIDLMNRTQKWIYEGMKRFRHGETRDTFFSRAR